MHEIPEQGISSSTILGIFASTSPTVSFTLTILGSNAALPALGRHPSAQYLQMEHDAILIDCGEGTQMQLTRYGCSAIRLKHIFISHLHGDHYLGLMGLLFSMHLQKRRQELHLYAPRGLDEIITLQLRHSRSALCFPLHFHAFDCGHPTVLLKTSRITVSTLPLLHKIPCCGFLFRENAKARRINKDRLPRDLPLQQIARLKEGADITDEHGNKLYSNAELTLPPKPSLAYAYCSDTAYSPALVPLVTGVDLLYHEATFAEADAEKAKDTRHSTARQAARIAREAHAKQLLIGHFSARNKDLTILQDEAREIFPPTSLALEGETVHISG